mgnify:CR=1 FL=1
MLHIVTYITVHDEKYSFNSKIPTKKGEVIRLNRFFNQQELHRRMTRMTFLLHFQQYDSFGSRSE